MLVLDAYCRFGPWSKRSPGQPYDAGYVRREHDKFHIVKGLCMSSESRFGVPELGNRAVARLSKEDPHFIPAWAGLGGRRFNAPSTSEFLEEARREGVGAVGLYPKTHGYPLREWVVGDLLDGMSRTRLPLILSWEEVEPDEIYSIGKLWPELPVILCEVPYTAGRTLLPLVEENPNLHIYFAPRFIFTGFLEDFCCRYGPERLLYGSALPEFSPGPLLSYVMYSRADEEAKELILGGNLLRLLRQVAWPVSGLSDLEGI